MNFVVLYIHDLVAHFDFKSMLAPQMRHPHWYFLRAPAGAWLVYNSDLWFMLKGDRWY